MSRLILHQFDMYSCLASVELEEDVGRAVRPDTLMGFMLSVYSVGGLDAADDAARGGEKYLITLLRYMRISVYNDFRHQPQPNPTPNEKRDLHLRTSLRNDEQAQRTKSPTPKAHVFRLGTRQRTRACLGFCSRLRRCLVFSSFRLTPTPIKEQTMLPKITEKEARAFIADASNAVKYPVIHQTVSAWLATKYTGSPCYNIKWNNK